MRPPGALPVFAAGDGRVYKTGYNKANGNYVFIAHGEQYVTKYLHLHKRKVKKGPAGLTEPDYRHGGLYRGGHRPTPAL